MNPLVQTAYDLSKQLEQKQEHLKNANNQFEVFLKGIPNYDGTNHLSWAKDMTEQIQSLEAQISALKSSFTTNELTELAELLNPIIELPNIEENNEINQETNI